MVKEIDWAAAEEAAKGNFVPYAKPGQYKAKVSKVDARISKNAQGGETYWLELTFEEGDVKFPKLSHPISFKNDNWRVWHFMTMLREFGIPEDKAKQAVQNAEGKNGHDSIVSAYVDMFERAAKKCDGVDIEVFDDTKLNPNTGKPYTRVDFLNARLAFGRDSKPTSNQQSLLDQGEEINLGEDGDIPF